MQARVSQILSYSPVETIQRITASIVPAYYMTVLKLQYSQKFHQNFKIMYFRPKNQEKLPLKTFAFPPYSKKKCFLSVKQKGNIAKEEFKFTIREIN